MGNNNQTSIKGKFFKKKGDECQNEDVLMISNQIKLFLKGKNILPCALKSDSNGNIISYSDCFNKVEISKIKYRKEECSEYSICETENEYLNKNIETLDAQTFIDISCIHCDSEFKRKAETINGFTKKISSIVAKYILYSFSIDQQYISLSSYWNKKIEDIAYSNSSDEEKAKEIDEIFKVIGYFIPLEIKVGGLFTYNTDKTKKESLNKINNEFNLKGNYENILLSLINNGNNENDKENKNSTNINIKGGGNGSWKEMNDSSKSYNFFRNHSKIKGGNIYAKNLDEWINSLEFNNSDIIQYLNFTKVKNILEDNLQTRLKIPLEIIDKKYEMRKEYIKIFQELKNNNNTQLYGIDSISKGICEEREFPLIVCKKFHIEGDGRFFRRITLSLCESFNDIIVGWNIISCWTDGTNGEWKLEENPLLKKFINVHFVSKFFRGECFKVFVYLMKFPQ